VELRELTAAEVREKEATELAGMISYKVPTVGQNINYEKLVAIKEDNETNLAKR